MYYIKKTSQGYFGVYNSKNELVRAYLILREAEESLTASEPERIHSQKISTKNRRKPSLSPKKITTLKGGYIGHSNQSFNENITHEDDHGDWKTD